MYLEKVAAAIRHHPVEGYYYVRTSAPEVGTRICTSRPDHLAKSIDTFGVEPSRIQCPTWHLHMHRFDFGKVPSAFWPGVTTSEMFWFGFPGNIDRELPSRPQSEPLFAARPQNSSDAQTLICIKWPDKSSGSNWDTGDRKHSVPGIVRWSVCVTAECNIGISLL